MMFFANCHPDDRREEGSREHPHVCIHWHFSRSFVALLLWMTKSRRDAAWSILLIVSSCRQMDNYQLSTINYQLIFILQRYNLRNALSSFRGRIFKHLGVSFRTRNGLAVNASTPRKRGFRYSGIQ